MRAITKGPEPQSLANYRSSHQRHYYDYRDKGELRTALVREQQGLCCYCMGKIEAKIGSMKIEHWQCQDRYPDEQLSYRNLLGGCIGGEGKPAHLHSCDTRKGNADLKWNPAEPTHHIEARLIYDSDGTIRSNDDEFRACSVTTSAGKAL